MLRMYRCRLLGTSGQNLDDIDLQSTIDNRVQILESCLKWNVIAPTCPDTLSKNPSFDFLPIRSLGFDQVVIHTSKTTHLFSLKHHMFSLLEINRNSKLISIKVNISPSPIIA